ncbi:Zinc finger protein 385D Zinc finger protein 659 [Channa argus]|uniref:Zinc finger protein 385D Zinc finger protein 659 n=1 Tax=Channa argus TaxID=215402 RepID=A0A6G1QBK3_CHAAH|nr:Zinc finger protein 385D Zinc finger protein 659 [Channa argus]
MHSVDKQTLDCSDIKQGTSAQGSPLLASLPVPGRPLQPQVDLKHLLPFRLNGSSPLSLFPNFNTKDIKAVAILTAINTPTLLDLAGAVSSATGVVPMDPVQKAVINHTFGVPQPLKKKQIISCNICHLRFNSTNQAEAHYKGHKHARKLKAMEAQKNRQRRAVETSSTGRERDRDRDREREQDRDKSKTSISEAALPVLVDTSLVEGTSLQSDLESANLEAKPEENPRSSVMLTPVSEVSSVELVTLSPPQISPSSQLSETASDTSAPEVPETPEAAGLTTESGSHADTTSTNGEPRSDEDKDPKKSKAHLHCPVCKVTVNSVSQLEAHNSGTKHKLMLEGHSVLPRRRGKMVSARAGCKSKRLGSKGSVGVPSKNFQCEVCEIFVNSETQLSQNVRWSGYAGVAVSAMKKAFTQYNLTSLSSQTKLALQKQLTKSLTTGFLPSPLTPPTLCTVATNPLALRHPVGTTTFIQTPFLGPALFRPAPGPLRATHTPIIFSPY